MVKSKYAAQIEKYDAESQSSGYSGGSFNLNFISVTKKEPKIYVQILEDRLIPVPIYSFVDCPDGKKRSFIDRSFVGKEDVIKPLGLKTPWGPLKPVRTCIGMAAQWTRDESHKYLLMREDVKVSAEKAEEVLENHPSWEKKVVRSGDGEDEEVTFPNIPRVGILQANRTVDQNLGVLAQEIEGLDSALLLIKRSGEGKDTRYNVMNIRELPKPEDDEFPEDLQIAMELSATVDQFIDTFISDDRYRSAGLLDSDDEDPKDRRSSKIRHSDDDDDEEESSSSKSSPKRSKRSYDESDDDDDDDEASLKAFIESKYA